MSDLEQLLAKDGDEVRIRRHNDKWYTLFVNQATEDPICLSNGVTPEAAIAAAVESRKPWPRYFVSNEFIDTAYFRFDGPKEIGIRQYRDGQHFESGVTLPEMAESHRLCGWREITAAEAAALVKPRKWTIYRHTKREGDMFVGERNDEQSVIDAARNAAKEFQAEYTVTDPDGTPIRKFEDGMEWVPA